MSPWIHKLKLWFIIVVIPCVFILIAITAILVAGYKHDTDPQGFRTWIIKNLGVQVASPTTNPAGPGSVGYFDIQYWNGRMVSFYVTPDVWEAATQTECDPWLIVAVAFSESTGYFNGCNSIGACGVWQFMPTTWLDLWPSVGTPSPLDKPSAANAACRYMNSNGMAKSINVSKEAFIKDFAFQPPVWNAYSPQAEFVYRLVMEIRAHGGETFVARPSADTDPSPPLSTTDTWWKQPIVFLFKEMGIWPEGIFAYNPGSTIIVPQEGDEWLSMPYSGGYNTNGGVHGQWYGECAIDISGGYGSTVISPINGLVTQKYIDGYGNPIIQIENSIYLVKLYHGDWTVSFGDPLDIGQPVGTEASHGKSTGPHTHFSVFIKGQPCVDPRFLANYPPTGN